MPYSEIKSDALYYAAIMLSHSTEANATKRAAQAIHIAQMLEKWLRDDVVPDYSGNLELIYYAQNRPQQSGKQTQEGTRAEQHRRHEHFSFPGAK
ncbi:MAG: hypothetical protein N2690_00455 [Rhodocyclaceae bacterium]|nr:hypothetical protein [Rhodocyclaceae bacterium]